MPDVHAPGGVYGLVWQAARDLKNGIEEITRTITTLVTAGEAEHLIEARDSMARALERLEVSLTLL